jgi:hypothetical protein
LGGSRNVTHDRTLQAHFKFVTARIAMKGSRLTLTSDLLHCDKVSWFGHIEAPTVRFVVQVLID